MIMIESVFIKLSFNPTNLLYASHPMTVVFQSEEEMDRQYPLNFNVFTEHLCPVMNSDSNKVYERKWTKRRFRGTIRPSTFPWMPGHYMLIVSQKGSWCERVDFTLDSMLAPKVTGVRRCQNVDMEWTLANNVDWSAPATSIFFNMPGTYSLKKRALQMHQYQNYSFWADRFCIPSLPKPGHFIINKAQGEAGDAVKAFAQYVASDMKYECVFADCASLYDKTRMDPYEELTDLKSKLKDSSKILFNFGSDADDDKQQYMVFLTNLDALLLPQGNYISRQLSSLPNHCHLVFVGTKGEVQEVEQMFGNQVKMIPDSDRIEASAPYADEAVALLTGRLLAPFHPTLEAQDVIARAYANAAAHNLTYPFSSRFVGSFMREHIRSNYIKRINRLDINQYEGEETTQLQSCDIDFTPLQGKEDTYQDCLQELNDMVGLEMVKDDIRITANRIRFLSERKEQGLPSNASANGHHIVLTGNPGTGKTTVARLLGRIYHQLGLISIGDVVVTERSKIVGEFIGQTEQNMQMIMRRAKGNVLFIDEAYSLVEDGKSSNDFGKHALECLLTMLSQPNPDMLVVLAGYEEPMMKMMQSNPGLPSRFPYHFHFPDYTECELMEICDRLLVKYQYEASDEVRQMLHKAIQKAVANKDKFFANARWIQQFIFEGVVPAMADRLAAQPRPLNRQQLQTILPSDVEAAVARMSQRPQTSNSRPVIAGFSMSQR
jgi:energy-coupling factor transporter ATP-binding protein EcfA2